MTDDTRTTDPASSALKTGKTPVGEIPPRQSRDAAAMALVLPRGQLSEEMQAYFDKCTDKIGFVPNVLEAHAFDNAKLEAFVAFYNQLMLAPSGLSKLEREMIAVVVSAANRCFYCLAAHGAAVREMSGDAVLGDMLVMNWRAATLGVRHTAMLLFAEKLTVSPHLVVEADRDALRRDGFSERDIWDISAVAAFYNMSNRLASATDMRPNHAYHALGR